MKNTIKVFGIIAIIAIIGFLAACSNGDTPTVHEHKWGEWTVTKEATCSAKGEETRVCTLDPSHKETRETAIDPDAHDWEQLEGTAPTCTTEGNGKRKCKLCGVEESGVLPALGHDWGDWIETKAPTETEDGEEERICAHDATHKETRGKAALNHTHDWGDWFINTPATCTADGESKRVCKLNENHYETEVIKELGHDWGDWIQTTAPTCTVAGVETQTCKHDASHKETRTGAAAIGHNYQWQVTTPATFTSEGVETEICSHDATHTRDTRKSDPLPITTAAEWNTATAAISGGGNDKTYDINVTGNFSIPGYSSATFGDVTGIIVNIRGAGTITLSAGSTGRLLYIDTNQTISLKETHLKGHSTNTTSLVYVNSGTFNMSGGTISGNTAGKGGGVYVYGYFRENVGSGTFNMSGGTISGNTATGSGSNDGGGGVYCQGGTFNMSGTAVISDNKAAYGAGVHMFLYSHTYLNMTGGTISGNIATQYGGGVVTSLNNSQQDGNIFINITGGSITGNTARLGGGIYCGSNSQNNGKPRNSVDLLSLDLVTGNTATTACNQLLLLGGLFLNGVKQAPRDDEEDGSDVLDYCWL